MGKVALSTLANGQLYLDANIIIYAVERHPDYRCVIEQLFALIDAGQAGAVTSELTLAECLVRPFAENDLARQQLYQAAVSSRTAFTVVPISNSILVAAAQLRAQHKQRLPDAIHLATAVAANCTGFITNDLLIKPVAGISIVQLCDIIP